MANVRVVTKEDLEEYETYTTDDVLNYLKKKSVPVKPSTVSAVFGPELASQAFQQYKDILTYDPTNNTVELEKWEMKE